ncbi:HAD-IA family hydrolase [Novosphingobium sp. FKTRR1]|uniref:HAD-IA family hydrolase n=1 Tax=Novosphingobium sp. FKTRR1 TaxID=2879118 RepID=UPI001CF0906A|nr:HAD-IA family hydrolase [Novosphingobium sp. FKTRR1]
MTDFPFSLVGFDLDGTLFDTALDLGHALNHALELDGRPTIPLAEVPALVGGGSAQMLRKAIARNGPVDEAALPALNEQLVAFYAENIARHTRFYPGAEAMLDALAARGVKAAIATNKREALARKLLSDLGVQDRFAAIIGGDTLGDGRAKPKPDMLHEMIARARATGGRTAFVGDTTFDVGAARAAGLPVVVVRFGFNDRPADELGADAVIDHFDELLPVLARLGITG